MKLNEPSIANEGSDEYALTKRSTATTFADNAAATQAWNALAQLTQLTDPKGVATQYTYNAFGEVLTETSPDIGTIRYTRDAAGRVTSTEDARGQITQITRDALGRPTEIRYAADHVVSYQYNGAGEITRIDDKSGATVYDHDNQGRITLKTQDVNDNPANPARFTTAYSYQNGRLRGLLIAHAGGVDEPIFSLEQLRAHFGDWFYID